jgi:hypothetical protein
VQGADHALELLHVLPGRGVAGVLVVRREEADRVVAPVVAQALLLQGVVLHELVHREQFDRGDAEVVEVLDRRRVRDAGVGAPQLLRDARVGHGQALDVGLVDDRLVVGRLRWPVDAPVEERVDDDRLRHVRRRVVVVALLGLEVVAEDRLVPVDLAVDGLGVGVEEELVRVAAQALGRVVGAVDAEAVALAGVDPGQEGVPDVAVHLGEADALLVALVVEEAELDLLGDLAEDREVGARAVVRCPEGVGATWPYLGHRGCSSCCGARRSGACAHVRRGGHGGGAVGGAGSVPPCSLPHTWVRVRSSARAEGRGAGATTTPPAAVRGGRRAQDRPGRRRRGAAGPRCDDSPWPGRTPHVPGSDLARGIPGGAGPWLEPLCDQAR